MKNIKGVPTMKKLLCFTLMLLCITLLAACGGTAAAPKVDRSIKAVIKPTALTANRNIAGINLTITLPAGVTPPLQTDGSVDIGATLEISTAVTDQPLSGSTGVSSKLQYNTTQSQPLLGATYIPYTPARATEPSKPGQLAIYVTVPTGFTETDQINIHLKVAEGAFPVETDFSLLSFEAFDTNGAPVTGLNPTLTTTIK